SKVRNAYDLIAEQWHATQRAPGYIEHVLRYVDRVLEGLPAGAKVLDLGCGTGEPVAKYVTERGLRVTGVDESEQMLMFARQTVPKAELIHADMVTVALVDTFDAAVAWDSMFHVERKHHAAIYRKLAGALRAGGRLLVSVGGSAPAQDDSVEGFTSEMYGQTFYYSGFAPAVAHKLIEASGFEIELWEVDDPTSRGHIAVIARKLASHLP
ncbi:MAG TPA: class I SAM-dependent methyltransferase, partial [Pyrinomonadaceae bacterium]